MMDYIYEGQGVLTTLLKASVQNYEDSGDQTYSKQQILQIKYNV